MDAAPRRRQTWGICLGLALAILAAYAPLWRAGFVPFDDPIYVTDNPHIRDGLSWKGLAWAFLTRHAGLWHPLTWLSYLADYQIFGMDARGFHLVNVCLHIANAILLFFLLERLTAARWPSAFAAGFFALHPMHVESVAWISERKDMLSTLFWILSTWAYICWTEKSKSGLSKRGYYYVGSLFLFAVGLMAKPMLVTLPLILLLLDYWPLRRRETTVARLLAEKVPYLVLAGAAGALTFLYASGADAIESASGVPWASRLENIPVSYARYILKAFLPVDLAVFYPYQLQWPAWEIAGATALLGLITAWVLLGAARRPNCVVGWFWFLIILAPVIGVIRVGSFSMADRYSYLSSTGLCLMLFWSTTGKERFLATVGSLALLVCLVLTHFQTMYWTDGEALFRHALLVTKSNPIMENALGKVLFEKGRVDESLAHLQRAVALAPNYPPPHFNLGNVLLAKGQTAEALAQFEINAALQPRDAGAQFVFGSALLDQGLVADAIPHLEQAVQLRPDGADDHYKLAEAYRRAARPAEAIRQYENAMKFQPNPADAASSLAWMLATSPSSSLRNGKRAVELAKLAEHAAASPNPKTLGILAAAYAETGDFSAAIATITQALKSPGVEEDAPLAALLRAQLALYHKGLPFRDSVK